MKAEQKFIIGTILATVVLIFSGVFILSGDKTSSDKIKGVVDENLLLASTTHAIGDPSSPVKIVEFADFQCPACALAYPITKNILKQNTDKVYFVFRHYPLPSHKNSQIAAKAAEAASTQGKFWEMHDLIYENQKDWSNSNEAKEIFTDYAKQLNLDPNQFEQDLNTTEAIIEKDYSDGNKLGVQSTPTFFINNQKYAGVIQEAQFQKILDSTN